MLPKTLAPCTQTHLCGGCIVGSQVRILDTSWAEGAGRRAQCPSPSQQSYPAGLQRRAGGVPEDGCALPEVRRVRVQAEAVSQRAPSPHRK
jgi:hypothetical protein